jgi:U4/U6 small nuclear ribonucleoprotein PRP3
MEPEASSSKRPKEAEGGEERPRKRRFKSRFGDAAPSAAASVASILGEDPAVKAAKLHDLQQSIAAQIARTSAALGQLKPNAPSLSLGTKKARDLSIRLDEQGREVDESGAVLAVKDSIAPVVTLKANQQVLKKAAGNPYLMHRTAEREKTEEGGDSEVVLDPELRARPARAKVGRPSFSFVQEGTFIRKAEQMREKELVREHRRLIRGGTSADRQDGAAEAQGDHYGELVRKIPPPRDALRHGAVPAIEWWDEALLSKTVRESMAAGERAGEDLTCERLYGMCSLDACVTHKYVQHPPAVKGLVVSKGGEAVMPVYLTKKERKRIRRQARLEKEQEKRDKVALGLMAAPEPKMKMSNFMKILGEQAIADPSRVEAMVQQQVSARLRAHLAANEARKLAPEQKKDKIHAKLAKEADKELVMAVFRVADLSDPRCRFKVDKNAQQWKLTGCVLLCPAANFQLVLVEGGARAIKHYIKLMVRRIKWDKRVGADGDDDEDERDDEGEDGDEDSEDVEGKSGASSSPKCLLVWRGTVQRRIFHNFRFQEYKSPEAARKVLNQRGLAHYWDLCEKSAVESDDVPIIMSTFHAVKPDPSSSL